MGRVGMGGALDMTFCLSELHEKYGEVSKKVTSFMLWKVIPI